MKKLTSQLACEIARSFEGVTEKDHFGSDAFSAGGRMFATVWHGKNEVNLMFTPALQRQFLEIDGEGFSAVPNKWGEKGATTAHLHYLERDVFEKALRAAWDCGIAKSVSGKNSAKMKSNKVSKKK